MLPESVMQNADAAAVAAKFGDAVAGAKLEFQEITLTVAAAEMIEVCRFLRDTRGYNRLSSITCVDWHPGSPRFEIVYHLQNTGTWKRFRLKARVDAEIESACSVWRSANWYEREVFDMFGVQFRNHPGLKRILMPEDWDGHPLRKDYPIHGHRYSYQSE